MSNPTPQVETILISLASTTVSSSIIVVVSDGAMGEHDECDREWQIQLFIHQKYFITLS
jgi:hypothetical protein